MTSVIVTGNGRAACLSLNKKSEEFNGRFKIY